MNHSSSPWKRAWSLSEDVDFLNHGAFGACPYAVLERQQFYRQMMERQPLQFLHRELEPWIDRSRNKLATLIGTSPANIVSVRNATEGVNTVLRSLRFSRGQSVLVTNHGYNACRNAVQFVADRWELNVQVAKIKIPVTTPEEITAAIAASIDETTCLAVIDHVTSPTALVFPLQTIVRQLQERGIMVLVDGAHAPGMLPLAVDEIGADFYTGNCHKWLSAPKGCGFLVAKPQHQQLLRPLTISHGANSQRSDRSRLHLEFDWTGTGDPTPWMCLADAIEFWEGGFPEGVAGMMELNRELTLAAKRRMVELCSMVPVASDESLLGSIASFMLPDRTAKSDPVSPLGLEALQCRLYENYRIEVPVFAWPRSPERLLRIACQCYNDLEQYEYLAKALKELNFQ